MRISVFRLLIFSGFFWLIALFSGYFSVPPAYAVVAETIEITGNQRVDSETVRLYMTIEQGQSFSAQDINGSVKALFETGLFSDVDIQQSGGRLLVSVTENPVIASVSFEGNNKITDEQFSSGILSKERSVLTQARVRTDVDRILESYRRIGRFRASVTPKIIELPNNQVTLVFEIDENAKAGVSKINFIGNHAFSNKKLLELIKTRPTGLLSWWRMNDVYDPDRLATDQEILRRFYHNNGYPDFQIISASADYDPERNIFIVTFVLDEGPLYTYSDIAIDASVPVVDIAALQEKVLTGPGDVYNAAAIERTSEKMVIAAAKQGDPFIQVRPRVRQDQETDTVSVVYQIDESPPAYIERINIIGNDRTRDYVIRREFDFVEGDAYNSTMMTITERRLRSLPFFESVSISSMPGSSPDRVIIEVQVKERQTGEISFGLGYSSTDGFLGNVSLTEQNFLGRGQTVALNISGGTESQSYEFAFTEPYFMGRRLSFSFDLYRRVLESDGERSYDEDVIGGGVAFAFPLYDDLVMRVFYKLYNRDVTNVNQNASLAIKDSEGSTLTSLAGYALIHNTINSLRYPTAGHYLRFQQEFAGLGGDSAYVRTTVEGRQYKSLYPDWDLVGVARFSGGYIHGIGKRLQIQDQFFKGGETVRGFETYGFGPRDALTEDALGGRAFIAGTMEANFPIPFLPDSFGLTGAVFADAGSVWDTDPESTTALGDDIDVVSNDFNLRASVGAGLQWESPFGPLRADIAYPFLKDDADKVQVFRLGGGTRF